ncbi:MAG TPA: ferredoxin reductase [Acidimicrobiia bacterium]
MAGTAVHGRLTWAPATVAEFIAETPSVRSIVLETPDWPGHLPGQHIDIRLTAEDGYQAQRSYSIAAPNNGDRVVITVELVEDGEVSAFLIEDLLLGDRIEIRGPIGGYFVWEPSMGGPLQLISGGSGVVPLMAMLRARVESGSDVPVRFLSSARTHEDVTYRVDLEEIASKQARVEIVHTLTRSHPPDWTGPTRRVDREMLIEHVWPPHESPLIYVCGPTGFVESVATTLVELGHAPERVRTERFGPTGGGRK